MLQNRKGNVYHQMAESALKPEQLKLRRSIFLELEEGSRR
jgi:hypothetical protein